MASKAVLDRQRSFDTVFGVTAQLPIVRDGVVALFGPPADAPNPVARAQLALAVLSTQFEALKVADAAHQAELDDDPACCDARDTTATTLYARLVELRALTLGLFGDKKARALGFDEQTPQNPTALAAYATTIGDRLLGAGTLAGRDGISWNPGAAGTEIGASVATLRGQIEDVKREDREAQVTLSAKNRALDAYNDRFRRVTTYLVGLFTLSGHDDLAARVRPSEKKPGRTLVEDSEGPEPTAAQPLA